MLQGDVHHLLHFIDKVSGESIRQVDVRLNHVQHCELRKRLHVALHILPDQEHHVGDSVVGQVEVELQAGNVFKD